MIDPYMQLQMMQQAGMGQYIPGGGLLSPQAHGGGAAQLGMMANMYGSPLAGGRMVDNSPMAGLGLKGPFAPLMNIAGNMLLQPMMQQHGLLPMGNAGSYQQARQARDYLQMQQEVVQGVSGKDAEGIFRSLRGMAAMSGVPMDAEQTAAARGLAESVAAAGPMLGIIHPELLDAISGEAGSVQSLAGRLMSANRYRTDPATGELGYGTESNERLVQGLFDKLFSQDNIARMQGLRAGEMGQLYERMSAEGLAGPSGSLRDRTIREIQAIRREGGFDALQQESAGLGLDGVLNDDNLQTLSNADLTKLRGGSETLRNRLSENDTARIATQLQDYVKSIAAIREVFGENGDPNAPMPKLIGALEGLTSGRMHQFDANRLNTMVRDMQALSQQSGKSIDQLVAMNQNNAGNLQQLMGPSAGAFAPTSTAYGTTVGQAFQQVGGATGFGTLSRTEAEAGAQSLFNRGLGSEMSNAVGALTRIEQAGGFADNDAGKDLRAALQSIDQGKETYIDQAGVERLTPTREREFRSFIGRGAVDGMNMGSFNMMLGDTFANQEALFSDPNRMRGAARQQFFDFEREVDRTATSRLMGDKQIAGLDREDRYGAARAISTAALDAMFDLTPEELVNRSTRRQVMVDAIQREAAGIGGVDYDDDEAALIADQLYGQSNQVARGRGAESTVAMVQMQGRAVSAAQRSKEAQVDARAGRNAAMSPLGPKGGGLSRLFQALQTQGDKGEDADLPSLIGDMFGTVDIDAEDITPLMQIVADKERKSEELEAELDGLDPDVLITADSADELRGEEDAVTGRRVNDGRSKFAVINEQIEQTNQELEDAVLDVQEEGRRIGIIAAEGDFNADDVRRGREAFEDLENRRDTRATRNLIRSSTNITGADRDEAADSKISAADIRAIARVERAEELKVIEAVTQADLGADADTREGWDPVKQRVVKGMEDKKVSSNLITEEFQLERRRNLYRDDDLKSVEDRVTELTKQNLDDEVLGNLNVPAQDVILRDRRSRLSMSVSQDDIKDRRREMIAADLKRLKADDPARQALEDAQLKDEEFTDAMESLRATAEYNEEDATEAIRTRTRARTTVLKDTFDRAQQQLLPEEQMVAAGILEEGQTLQNRGELRERLEALGTVDALDADLREKMITGTEAEQKEAWTEHLKRQAQARVFSEPEDDETAEVERASKADLRKANTDLAIIDELGNEFLRDETALAGSPRGVQALRDFNAAKDAQQTIANKFDVSRGQLYANPSSVEFTERQEADFKKEFKEMSGDDRQAILEELQSSPNESIARRFSDETELREGDFIGYQRTKMIEEISDVNAEFKQAAEALTSGAYGDYRSMFDLTEEDRTVAQELFREDVEVTDAQTLALKTLDEAIKLTEGGEEITDEQKRDIVEQMVSGEEVDLESLTPEERELYENIQEVEAEAARELLEEGVGGLSEKDTKAAQELFREDVKVTEEQFVALKQLDRASELAGAEFSDEQKKKAEFSDEQKREIVTQLANNEKIDTTDMTDEQKDVLETREALEDLTALDAKEITALEKLAKLETEDIGERAEALGVSEEEYLEMLRGSDQDAIDKLNDRVLFDEDEDGGEASRERIRTRLQQRDALDKKIESIKPYATSEKATERERADAASKMAELTAERDDITAKINEQMVAAGYDPEDDVSKKEFFQRYKRQGDIFKLKHDRETYQETKELGPLKAMDAEELAKAIGVQKGLVKETEQRQEEMAQLTLGEAQDELAVGLGFGRLEDVDDMTAAEKDARKGLKFEGSVANQELLAKRLKQMENVTIEGLEGAEGGDEATGLRKLDWFADAYKKAQDDGDEDEVERLAELAGMSPKQFRKTMMETDAALNLDRADLSNMNKEAQLDFLNKELSLRGRDDVGKDVAEAVDKEQKMELFGTLKVEGVVNGKATFKDTVGNKR
jgi:hypothetical protein